MSDKTSNWDTLFTLPERIKLIRKGDGPPWDLFVRIPGKYKDNTLKVDSILTTIKNLSGLIEKLSLNAPIIAQITFFISFLSSLLEKLLTRFCFEHRAKASISANPNMSAEADVIRGNKNE